jgi:hypothetical protein
MAAMRRAALLTVLALAPGCAAVGAPGAPLLAIPAAVEAVSLRAFGRTTGDALVSLVTGEDCSIARIGRGEAYCGQDPAPTPPPVCTRSLGAVDCWTVPPAALPAYRGVADGPATLSRAQEDNRIGWTGRIGRALEAAATPAPAPPEPVIVPAPMPVVQPAPEPSAAIEAVAAEAAARAAPVSPRPQPGGTAAGAARRALERPAAAGPASPAPATHAAAAPTAGPAQGFPVGAAQGGPARAAQGIAAGAAQGVATGTAQGAAAEAARRALAPAPDGAPAAGP